MNNKYSDPIERITAYYSVVSDYPKSISQVASELGIDADIVKKDFELLSGDSQDDSEYEKIKKKNKHPLIIPSDDDETEITYEPYPLYDDQANETIFIPATMDEYMAFNNLFEQEIMPKTVEKERSSITSTIRNKKYVHEFNAKILDRLDIIESAISDNRPICFDYRVPDGNKQESVKIHPSRIGLDATENRYVVIAATDKSVDVYDLEYIIGDIAILSREQAANDDHLLSKADKVWGFEFNTCHDDKGNIVDGTVIKVLFYNEANVINKAIRDLTHRNPYELYKDDSGNLIFSDEIYGIDSFLNWIYSFGSSAQILEPKWLIDRVIKEISSRLENI